MNAKVLFDNLTLAVHLGEKEPELGFALVKILSRVVKRFYDFLNMNGGISCNSQIVDRCTGSC